MQLKTLSAFLLCSLPVVALTTGAGCSGGSSSLPNPTATATGSPTATATTSPFGTATPTQTSSGTPLPTATSTPSSPIPTRFANDLVFSSSEVGQFGIGIYRSEADGSNRRVLVSPRALQQTSQGAVIRPGGREVAFYSRAGDLGGVKVYLMNADGTNVRSIALTAGVPAWSPDGTRLVAMNRSNNRPFLMNPDGSGINFLGEDGPPLDQPTFSPDGRSVFLAALSPGNHLYKIPLATEELMTIDTGNITFIRNPRFSPDGQTLSFVGYQNDSQRGLYLANPDGSSPQLVPNTTDVVRAIWSPNNALAVETTGGLYSIRRDGSKRRFIAGGFSFDWR